MSVSSLSVSVGGEWCCYWLYVAAAETTLRGRKVVLRIAETRDHTKATAEGTFWLAETTARNTLRLTLAAADTNLWTAQENARVTAHQSLHSDLALPWTGYLVAAAVARRDWWTGFHATYVGLAVDRNSAGRVPAPGSGLALGVVVGQVCGCLRRGQALRSVLSWGRSGRVRPFSDQASSPIGNRDGSRSANLSPEQTASQT